VCSYRLLISALYNVVDQLFIGNSSIGYMGNVATTVVFPLTILGSRALALLMGDGASAFLVALPRTRRIQKKRGRPLGQLWV
jgi:hypothetical protein